MTNSNGSIYKIECLPTGKIYIGSTRRPVHLRWREHLSNLSSGSHHNPYLQRSWNKYGEEFFKFEILEEVPLEDLGARERYWISHFSSIDPDRGYNLASGGEGNRRRPGIPKSDEVKLKIKETNSSPLAKQRSREANLGKQVSPETRNRLRESLRKYWEEKRSKHF